MSAHAVTDRAFRYRANQAIPGDAPEVCTFCGMSEDLEVGHLDGHEENNVPHNLTWTCRSCNIRCGITLRNAGLGRLTRQFNPQGAKSASQYADAVKTLLGEDAAMSVKNAVRLIQATSHAKRAQFARHNNPGAQTLGEYMEAIADHTRGRHDKGGRVIHETPKSRRSRFAREIADIKKQRHGGGDEPDWVRSNPSIDEAAQLAESWSGRPASQVTEITEAIRIRTNLADLGGLEELVIAHDGYSYTLRFGHDVRVSAVPPAKGADGTRQIVFVGGNQSVDLAKLDIEAGPDKVVLGDALSITYYARKSHLHAKEVPWEHQFGEEGGVCPTVVYDTLNRRLELVGGAYFIKLGDYDGRHSRGIRN